MLQPQYAVTQGGDRSVSVLPPGKQPTSAHLLPLHVRAAGEQPAPLLAGSLHPDRAISAAEGAHSSADVSSTRNLLGLLRSRSPSRRDRGDVQEPSPCS